MTQKLEAFKQKTFHGGHGHHHAHQGHQGHDSGSEQNMLQRGWGYVMVVLIGWFAISCVEQFAQARQGELDQEKIEALHLQELTEKGLVRAGTAAAASSKSKKSTKTE